MGVPLQLILGIFLAIFLHSHAKTLHIRHRRDTVFPLLLSNQNSSEKYSHRDINKIQVEPPKTDLIETVDNKDKLITSSNNVDTNKNQVNSSENNESDNKGNVTTKEKHEAKIKKKNDAEKEIEKFESGRSIDSDTSKFWSSDFHNKNNVYTLSTSGDEQKFFHDDEDDTLVEPNYPSTTFSVFSEIHGELTTPKTQFFDKKFKEAVDSIEQTLDNEENDEFIENDNNGEFDDGFKTEKLLNDINNGTLDYIKTKSIINNETVDKNALHKDVDVEETKILNFEKTYNDSTSYDSSIEHPKSGDTTEQVELSTTNKISTNSDKERNNNYILNNQIETGSVKSAALEPFSSSAKYLDTKSSRTDASTVKDNDPSSSTYKKDLLEPIEHNIIPLQLSESSKDQKGSFSDSKSAEARIPELPVDSIKTSLPENATGIATATSPRTTYSTTTKVSENVSEKIIFVSNVTEKVPDSTERDLTTTEKPTTAVEIANSTDENYSTTSEETTTEVLSTSSNTSEVDVSSSTASNFFIMNSSDTTTGNEDLNTSPYVLDNTTNGDQIVITTEFSTTIGETTTLTSTVNKYREEKLLETTTETDTTTENFKTQSTTLIITTTSNQPDEITILAKSKGTEDVEIKEISTFDNTESTTSGLFVKKLMNEEASTLGNLGIQDATTKESTTIEPPTTAILSSDTTTSLNENITKADEESKTEETTQYKTTTFTESTTETSITNRHLETPQENLESSTTEFSILHGNNIGENLTTMVLDTTEPDISHSTQTNENPAQNSNFTTNQKTIVEFKKANITDTNSSTEVTDTTEQGSTERNPTGELTNDSGSNKSTIAAIAISSVGAICLVLLGVLLYVMRKRQKSFKYGPRCTPVSLDEYSIDNLSVYNSVRRKGKDRASKRSFGNPAFEDPSGVSHPLNFPALSKFSTNTEDINAEFEDIPQIHARASELPDGCDSKNRYANVIPLPESRVALKLVESVPNSDYINANYVTGPKNVRGYYIATQGPMQNTVDDFWRMIWEQQAKVVLMMTHLVENGLEKCVDYLPESEVVDNHRLFGDFQVTLKKREVKEKYIISSLQLKNMVSNSWRDITHFWYLGWPEKGVPNEANSLIAFLIEARSYMKTATIDKRNDPNDSSFQNGGPSTEHNPVIVHCSPGTGRTGVVIACDIAIREFETTRLVDIPKIVYKIRRDRANSVQSKEQYQFIYKVVSLYATKLTGGQFLKE